MQDNIVVQIIVMISGFITLYINNKHESSKLVKEITASRKEKIFEKMYPTKLNEFNQLKNDMINLLSAMEVYFHAILQDKMIDELEEEASAGDEVSKELFVNLAKQNKSGSETRNLILKISLYQNKVLLNLTQNEESEFKENSLEDYICQYIIKTRDLDYEAMNDIIYNVRIIFSKILQHRKDELLFEEKIST